MDQSSDRSVVFLTVVSTPRQRAQASLLTRSIQTFGGRLSDSTIWVFEANPAYAPCSDLKELGATVLPLSLPESIRPNWFAGKVAACARAEALAGTEVGSLVWMATDCLVVSPPLLLELDEYHDIALRPVHIANIGLPAGAEPDAFWRSIFAAVGVADVTLTVRSFVDDQLLRAYFNSHVVSVNPSLGLLGRWLALFETLMLDQAFQAGPCGDQNHQVFLHQAVLSTLIATTVPADRIRLLPPTHSYPYNLQAQVPVVKRAQALNDLTCVATEGRALDPALIQDIEIGEPLRGWLVAHAGQA